MDNYPGLEGRNILAETKISPKQFRILVFQFIIGSKILFISASLAAGVQQDAWISGLIALVIGTCIVFLYTLIGKQHRNQNFLQFSEMVLGKWVGKVVSFLLCIYFLIVSIFLTRDIGDFMTIQIMPDTPMYAIVIVFMLVTIMGVRLGLEVIGRAAEIFYPWVILLLLFLIASTSIYIEWENIQPLFEHKISDILKTSYTFIGFPYLELILFLLLIPEVNHDSSVSKSFILGSVIGGGTLVVITLYSILVLGVNNTILYIYPTYVLAEKISIGQFLNRIEIVVGGVWFLTIFIKLSLCVHFAAFSLAHIFNLKQYKSLVFPLGMIIIISSIAFIPNLPYLINYDRKTWFPLAIIMGLLLPTVIYTIHMMKKWIKQ